MTKRRLLIIALALVAIVVAVPVVPWANSVERIRDVVACSSGGGRPPKNSRMSREAALRGLTHLSEAKTVLHG